MQQSRLFSLLEQIARVLTGLLIMSAWSIWWLDLPNYSQALWVSWPYSVIAIIIGYFWRRLFTRLK